MVFVRIAVVFVFAAIAEIGGAWLIWHAVRDAKPWWWACIGVLVLGAYGFIASLQPDASFARVLAAYGGVFIAGSLAWGAIFDKFKPSMWDYIGAAIALLGAAVIILAPLFTRGRA
ncbi:MAG: YnfA family protein [Humibacter sp.]